MNVDSNNTVGEWTANTLIHRTIHQVGRVRKFMMLLKCNVSVHMAGNIKRSRPLLFLFHMLHGIHNLIDKLVGETRNDLLGIRESLLKVAECFSRLLG